MESAGRLERLCAWRTWGAVSSPSCPRRTARPRGGPRPRSGVPSCRPANRSGTWPSGRRWGLSLLLAARVSGWVLLYAGAGFLLFIGFYGVVGVGFLCVFCFFFVGGGGGGCMLLLGGCKFVSLVLFIKCCFLVVMCFCGLCLWGLGFFGFFFFFGRGRCCWLFIFVLFLFCFKLSYIYDNNCYALLCINKLLHTNQICSWYKICVWL